METDILNISRHAPSLEPFENAVNWSIFRHREEAQNYIKTVRLSAGHELIGGYQKDSIGSYWWVGVRVPSLTLWGSRQAVNKHGRHGD